MLSGAAWLTFGSVIAKLMGALYRVPLTNILGAEGMGIYQLIFPVYALFITLSTAGIPTALARITAEKRALGQPFKGYLVCALVLLAALGALASLILLSLAGTLSKWQGNEAARGGYLVIAPALLFTAIIAGFRGYFQGEMNMLPTAVSNLVEQGVKLALGVALAYALKSRGVAYAVSGALVGVLFSEVAALAYLFVSYLIHSKKSLPKSDMRLERGDVTGLFKVAFPIAIVAILLPLSSFFDSMIIVNRLRVFGLTEEAATAGYGLIAGPVNSLLNMPIVLIMSLAIVAVPAVSMSRVRRDVDGVMLKSRLCVKLCYLVGVPCAAIFIAFAKEILTLIYPALTHEQLIAASNLLIVGAPSVVFLSAMQIYVSLLQALDKTKYAVLSLSFAITLKILLSVFLTGAIGIVGAQIASLVMSATAFFAVDVAYFKICGMHLEKNVAINVLLGVIMCLSGYAVKYFVKNYIAALAVGVVVSVLLYGYLALLSGLLGREEIEFLPMKGIVGRLHRLVRFWEYK